MKASSPTQRFPHRSRLSVAITLALISTGTCLSPAIAHAAPETHKAPASAPNNPVLTTEDELQQKFDLLYLNYETLDAWAKYPFTKNPDPFKSHFFVGLVDGNSVSPFTKFQVENWRTPHLAGEPSVSDVDPMNFSISNLENKTDTEQTLTSSAFSQSVTNGVDTATTHGWKVGGSVETSAAFEIPFVGKTGVKLTVSGEYNGSTSETQHRSTTEAYTAPAQNIKVPPHATARVSALISRAQVTGTVTRSLPFTSTTGLCRTDEAYKAGPCDTVSWHVGDWFFRNEPKDQKQMLVDVLDYVKEHPTDEHDLGFPNPRFDNVSYDPTTGKGSLDGAATFKAVVGTEFNVKVDIVSDTTGQPISAYVIPDNGSTVKMY